MASYELKIDLVGGQDAEDVLKRLSELSGGLGRGGGVFGGDATKTMESNLSRVFNLTAKMRRELDQMNNGWSKGASALKSMFAGWGNDFYRIREFFRDNPSQKSPWLALRAAEKLAAMGPEKMGTVHAGGGIASINNPQMAMQELQKQVNEVFKDTPEAKLERMRQRGERKFQAQQERDEARRQKDAMKAELAPMQGPDLGGIMRANFKKKQLQDANAFKMDIASLVLPLSNPMSPWSTMWGAKNVFKGMNTEHGAAFRASKLGGMGAMGATALLVGAATATGLALKALTFTVKETLAAYENARQIYSKALENGMGLQWSTKRGLLASIMGVSEQDVFRFGAQMAYLNTKLEQASKTLDQTATPLTQVSWQMKILKADLSSLFAKIAANGAPVILDFISATDLLVKTLVKHSSELKAAAFGAVPGLGILWAGIRALAKLDTEGLGNMPPPSSWMKQLPASQWEHMGLVIGGGGAKNYAKETARNTRETAKAVQIIAAAFTGGGGRTGGGGAGGSWGMSLTANNP